MTLRLAPDKLALLLSLVPYLDEVAVVSVAEAAEHFKVSEEDIRSAVNLIAASGVATVDHIPLDNDMFDIDWDAFLDEDVIVLTRTVVIDDTPRMSRGEASALIAGLQYLAGLPGSADNDVLHGLLRKLSNAGGAGTLIAGAGALEGARAEVAQALTQHRVLQFDYTSSDGRQETRAIDVVQVESENNEWYVRGWCHDRQALRLFRLDRMTAIRCTEQAAEFDSSTVALPDSLFDEGSADFAVTLEVSRAGLPLLGDFLRGVKIPKTGDPIRVDVRVAHLHGLKRIVVAHPDHIRVLAPDSAVRVVAEWAAAGLSESASR